MLYPKPCYNKPCYKEVVVYDFFFFFLHEMDCDWPVTAQPDKELHALIDKQKKKNNTLFKLQYSVG